MERWENKGIQYAPDERAEAQEQQESTIPETVRVGDEDVRFEDLLKTYENKAKFERASHERSAEAKRALDQARQERQAAEAAAKRQDQEHQAYLASLKSLTAPKEEPKDEAPNLAEMLKGVDPVGDEEWHPKLADAIEKRDQVREQQMREQFNRELENRTKTLQQQLEQKLQTATSTWEQREARKRAKDEAEEHNRTLFDRRIKTQYGDIAEQLSDEDREKVYRTMRTQIGDDVGTLGQDGQWRWNESAVDRAVWAEPTSRKLMLAREAASARSDGLSARTRGEAASRSTPSRAQRRTSASPEDALAAKYRSVQEQLSEGRITPSEAAAQFTAEERVQIAPSLARAQRAT